MAEALPTDATHGFSRAEMFTELLPGTWKDSSEFVLFLVSGRAGDWPSDIKDLPAASPLHGLQKALKAAGLKERTKVLLAEAAPGDAEGDVLVFPGPARFCALTAGGVAELVEALLWGKGIGAGRDLEDGHIFVCGHAARDARCGFCAPRLLEALAAAGAAAGAASARGRVRKCSHVGGHVYAGNMLVFAKGTGDYYGYVTPDNLPEVLSGQARLGRLWRGALGLTKEEALLAARRAGRAASLRRWAPAAAAAVLAAGAGLALVRWFRARPAFGWRWE